MFLGVWTLLPSAQQDIAVTPRRLGASTQNSACCLGKSMTTPSLCSCMEAKKKECGCQKTTALRSSYLMGTSLHSLRDLEKAPDFQASKGPSAAVSGIQTSWYQTSQD